jgi:hypothetical protein
MSGESDREFATRILSKDDYLLQIVRKVNMNFVSPVCNNKPRIGQTHVWSLVATKPIRKGKEVLVCYGDTYANIRAEVGYTTSCG